LKALLFTAALTAMVTFALPVRTRDFGSCGLAGLWVTGLVGDPTGPGDPASTYAEYNACRLAARPVVLVMLAALLVALVAAWLLVRSNASRQQVPLTETALASFTVLPEGVARGGRPARLTHASLAVIRAASDSGQQGDLSAEGPPLSGQAAGRGHALVQVTPEKKRVCHAVEHRSIESVFTLQECAFGCCCSPSF
jgi:hypothetical protein